MAILWWLAPAAVATLAAMLWVSWLGRDGRGQVDRDVANARLAAAIRRGYPKRATVRPPVRARDRSTGIAVRPSRTGAKRS